MLNYYQILGVTASASEVEIKKSFKKMALLYHPDRNPDDMSAEEKFKLINEAYQILSNPHSKARYDQLRNARSPYRRNGTNGYYYYRGQRNQPTQGSYRRTPPPPQQKRQKRAAPPLSKHYISNAQASVLVIVVVLYFFAIANSLYGLVGRKNYYDALQLYKQAEYDSALWHLNQSVIYEPQFAKAHFLMGLIYSENMNYYPSASKSLSQAIENAREPMGLYFLERGKAYSHQALDTAAQEDFNKALSINALDSHTIYSVADAYFFQLKDYERAITTYSLMLDHHDSSHIESYIDRGIAYGKLQQKEAARQDFEEAMQYAHNDPKLGERIANIYHYDLKFYDLAISSYDSLIERNGAQMNFHKQKGIIYRKDGNYGEAMKSLTAAIALDDVRDSLYYFRAQNYIDLGQVADACTDWQRAKELGYKGQSFVLDFYCQEEENTENQNIVSNN